MFLNFLKGLFGLNVFGYWYTSVATLFYVIEEQKCVCGSVLSSHYIGIFYRGLPDIVDLRFFRCFFSFKVFFWLKSFRFRFCSLKCYILRRG